MKPIGRNILLRPDEPITRVGKLHIPEGHARTPTRGKVVAVGEDVPSVAAGMVLLYAKYAGDEIEVDGVPHLVITEDDVLLIEEAA